MKHELPTVSRWRWLLRPRWLITFLVLAVCAWPCWRALSYITAVSEVKAYATWTGPGFLDFILRPLFRSAHPNAKSVPEFRGLVLFKGRDLKCIGHLLPRLRPTHLEAEECMAVDLDALKGLTSLDAITFRSCPVLQNVDGLKGLTGLRMLDLFNCRSLQNVDALSGLTGLETLQIDGCPSLRNVDVLAGLTGLQNLFIGPCATLQRIDDLNEIPSLKWLDLSGCTALQDLDGLKVLSRLPRLDLSNCTALQNLDALKSLTGLHTLDLRDTARKDSPISQNVLCS